MHHRRISIAVVCLFAPAALAQRTWIVDALGGPGHDFTDLPPALAAASHGDQIVLRPGAYRGASTDRGVSILGVDARLTSVLTITGLPAGRAFVLANRIAARSIVCVDNPGRIHLDRIEAVGENRLGAPIAAVEVARCHAFTASGCRFLGGPTRVSRSSTAFTGCEIVGAHAFSLFKYGYASSAGLIAADSDVTVARCRVRGGDEATLWIGALPPSPAVNIVACASRLMGGAGDWCRAGASVSGLGASAVVVSGGSVTIDPTLPLQPSGNASAITGGPVTMRRMPALFATGAPPGGRLATELYAPTGWLAALLLGTPRTPTPTPWGALWLDGPFVVDVGPVGTTERRAIDLDIPAEPSLRGLALGLQSAGADFAAGAVELSNPAAVVVD